MHVAAPILDDGQIIGVVTVAKPNSSLQPYIDRSERRLLTLGLGLIVLGLLVGAALSWWLTARCAGSPTMPRRSAKVSAPLCRTTRAASCAAGHGGGAHAHAAGRQGLCRALRAHPDP
jgi:hypothetical protein